MKPSTLVVIVLVVIAVIGMVAWKVLKPKLDEQSAIEASDAKDLKGTASIAIDSFAGYFPLRSKDFRMKMRQSGYGIRYVDDKADYPDRMKKLNEGDYDFIVATIDSYELNAAKHKYPGVIFAVLDESQGADALVCRKDLGLVLKDFTGKRLRVAFTGNSPSHHLLKFIVSMFGEKEFLPTDKSLRLETTGSEEALAKLLDEKADCAVLWEPDVSKAVANPKFAVVFSSKDTKGAIVDVLIVNRDYLKDNLKVVKLVLANYFRALKYYLDNPDRLKTELAEESGLKADQVDAIVKGIAWQTLSQNCLTWFGISKDGEAGSENLVYAIENTADTLVDAGDFKVSPIPKNDPYWLMYSDPLAELCQNGLFNGGKNQAVNTKFAQLSEDAWMRQKEVGNLKFNPIVFQSGTSVLTFEGKLELDRLAKKIGQFNYRIKVIGHVRPGGDPEPSLKLSIERAEAVMKYLQITHGLDPNRFWIVGLGGEKPLIKDPDETERAWWLRCQRVEIVLLKEDF